MKQLYVCTNLHTVNLRQRTKCTIMQYMESYTHSKSLSLIIILIHQCTVPVMRQVIKMSVKHTHKDSFNYRLCIVSVIKLVTHTQIPGIIGHSACDDVGDTHRFLELQIVHSACDAAGVDSTSQWFWSIFLMITIEILCHLTALCWIVKRTPTKFGIQQSVRCSR